MMPEPIDRNQQATRAMGTLMVGWHDFLTALRLSGYTGENSVKLPIDKDVLDRAERLMDEMDRMMAHARRFIGQNRKRLDQSERSSDGGA